MNDLIIVLFLLRIFNKSNKKRSCNWKLFMHV